MSANVDPGRERESSLLSSVVFFDFSGTLDADGIPAGVRFYRAYRAAGGSLPYGTFAPLYRVSERRLAALPAMRSAGFQAAIEAHALLIREGVSDGARVDAAALARGFHAEALAVVARNRPVLERLASTLRLGVVAAAPGNLHACLAELGILSVFSAVIDAAELGFERPDIRLFATALAALDVGADAAWMVGDDPDVDVRVAARLGLKTCWIAPPDREAPSGVIPTLRVASLADLEGFGG
jgi:putative hydrolase of the HAD superfamily